MNIGKSFLINFKLQVSKIKSPAKRTAVSDAAEENVTQIQTNATLVCIYKLQSSPVCPCLFNAQRKKNTKLRNNLHTLSCPVRVPLKHVILLRSSSAKPPMLI